MYSSNLSLSFVLSVAIMCVPGRYPINSFVPALKNRHSCINIAGMCKKNEAAFLRKDFQKNALHTTSGIFFYLPASVALPVFSGHGEPAVLRLVIRQKVLLIFDFKNILFSEVHYGIGRRD